MIRRLHCSLITTILLTLSSTNPRGSCLERVVIIDFAYTQILLIQWCICLRIYGVW